MTSITQKIATHFGEKQFVTAEAGDRPWLDLAPLHQQMPFEAYDEVSDIYWNQDSVGFVIEAAPLIGASSEATQLISNFINGSLPDEAVLQCLYFASPKIGPALSGWMTARSGLNPVFEQLAEARVNYLYQGVHKSIINSEPYLLRDAVILISVSLPDKTEDNIVKLRDTKAQFENMAQSIGLPIAGVKPERLLSLASSWLYPNDSVDLEHKTWDKLNPLYEQLIKPGAKICVEPHRLDFPENDWAIKTLSMTQLPKQWQQSDMQNIIGDMFDNQKRLSTPFFLQLIVKPLPKEAATRRALIKGSRSQKMAESPLARILPRTKKIAQDWQFTRESLDEGETLVEVCFQAAVLCHKEHIETAAMRMINLFAAKQWTLVADDYLQYPHWLMLLPMTAHQYWQDLRFFGRIKTVLGCNATALLPLQGEWKGGNSPGCLLAGRRGQVAWWDPFDNKEGNYNTAVVGQSGSGKSVFMQELATGIVGSGGRVFVLDIGRSFEKACYFLGGEFIEFKRDKPLCINPFSTINSFNESLEMLKPVFAAMASPSKPLTDLEDALLEQALKHAWNNHKQNSTVTHVAAFLSDHKDSRAHDLATMLYPYTKEGMYGEIFEGECQLDFGNPYIVLELEELKSRKDLQTVVLMLLMYHITEFMYRGSRSQRIACIIDEAWDLLGGETGGKFIETGSRRARKYNGSFITGTQSLRDYYKTPAAMAAFENADWLVMLKQKPESIDSLKKENLFTLTPYLEQLIKSIKTLQGKYSELIIKGPQGYAVSRLWLDPFSEILYSSKGEEYLAVQQLRQQGYSMSEAISEVVATRGAR